MDDEESSIGSSEEPAAVASRLAEKLKDEGSDVDSDDSGFDSDDARRFNDGEPYYWERPHDEAAPVGMSERLRHLSKYYTFKAARGVNFMGLVSADLLGLDRSKFQWAIDAVEEEKIRRERAQQEQMELFERKQRETLSAANDML